MDGNAGKPQCQVDGCGELVKIIDWCLPHYRRWYRTGNPLPQPKPPPLPCSVDGCGRESRSKGYCMKHYRQWQRTGDPVATARQKAPDEECSVDGCDTLSVTKGLCRKHYMRLLRYGDPATPPRVRPPGSGTLASNGRLVTHSPGHPLAARNGDVYLHRKVLFDTIGWGPHYCYWCPKVVGWGQQPGPDGVLNVVQLDGNYTNVELPNLVAACNECTQRVSRGEIHKLARQRRRSLNAAGY